MVDMQTVDDYTDAFEGLNERQARFAYEYTVDANGGAAYIRAGYDTSGDSAHACASRLLTDARIQRAIAWLRAKSSARLDISRESVLRGLQRERQS